MKTSRRKFSTAFKTKVVIEALKERETVSELAQKYDLHPNLITNWKREFLANAEKAFGSEDEREQLRKAEQERDELFRQIGQLKVENDWLKKKVL
jgi:transposase